MTFGPRRTDVVDVLGLNGQADGVGLNALIQQLLRRELGVGGGGGVDDQGLYVGYVGQQGKDLQAVDEPVDLFLPAPDLESEDRSAAVGKYFLCGILRSETSPCPPPPRRAPPD